MNDSASGFMKYLFVCLLIFTSLNISTWSALAQQPHHAVRVIAKDEAGNPLPAARVELKRQGAVVNTATTNDKGEAEFAQVSAGTYEVTVSKDEFEALTQSDILVQASLPVVVEFALPKKVALTESVNVQASTSNAIEQVASPATELQRTLVKDLPNKPATVTDTLPLLPGVVRSPQGEINISGSSENKSAFIVNSADVTDPATGQFGVTVPVDSVETISVFKTPYLAQYGRFTAGVVAVETRRGGDKWHYEINDPLPEFRIFSGHLRGIREASPRLVFNGPLLADRLYFSEGIEYDLQKRPVRTLPFPVNETKQESVNSFTQLDYLFSQTHTLTGTLHIAPRHINFVNLNFFDPQPVTPSFRARDYTTTLSDRLTTGANFLESTLSYKNFGGRVWAQGSEDMTLAPALNSGNYFSQQDRKASRLEWLETYSLAPLKALGDHNLKFGTSLARTDNDGEFLARPVNIVDQQNRLLKRIDFVGGSPFDRSDMETAFFGQDHWVVTPQLSLDLGSRFERQGITETIRVAPRLGLAWTPFKTSQTIIRSGFGLFYDRVPLSVYSFDRYPEQRVTTFDGNGNILDGPRQFANITESAATKTNPFIYSKATIGNFAPYSLTWSVEVEHPVTKNLKIRANYLQSNGDDAIVIAPKVVQGRDALVLGSGGRMRYRQFETTARWNFQQGQAFFSYVRSRTRGDLNEFNNYLGNYPFPVVRPNRFSSLNADLPQRFLAWGRVQLPWQMRVSPIVEYRNGFPYAVTDAAQNYVGQPNTSRFPNFFSFDARVSKDIKLNPEYALRLSVSGFNLTNHFNPLTVHSNIADPQFGLFFGNYKRRFRLDFDVLF
ncbi:MAG: TonB-dependent receptor [Acidobacteria bacterium]|nr:TonB-dependent receptor [Acidobacteriota bacterium]